jgi:hypothetical protein
MKDQLEDFINENRGAFDHKTPSDKVWNNIEPSLPQSKNSLWSSVLIWRAAAVVFMALSVYLFVSRNSTSVHFGNDIALKEFNDVEAFYVEQISEKVHLIDEFHRNEGLNGFTQDFKQLEAMYMVLKEEMKNHPNSKVKDALVLNLLVRIDLLNQQLHSLEKETPTGEKKSEGANI